MKKLITILGIFFLLTSCYSNPKDLEKINELEKEILKNDFERSLICANEIEDFEDKYNSIYIGDNDNSAYTPSISGNFYSNTKNSCIFEVSLNYFIDEQYGALKLYHSYPNGDIYDTQDICNNVPLWTFVDLCSSGKVIKIDNVEQIK